MHLVAGAIEEAGIDEDHAIGRRGDAGLEVDTGAPLLVHDAHLQRVPGQPEQVLDAAEELVGEGHLGRAVHLRLDDIDAAGARVALAAQIVQGGEAGDHGIEDALGYLAPFLVEDRGVAHQMADVAHEQQGSAMQGDFRPVESLVDAVRIQCAGEGPAALAQAFRQVALHQAQPVAIDRDLVVGVHSRHGVLAVHDGGQRRFHEQVLDAGAIGAADRAGGVDLDLDVQAMVLQQ
ncbi:hypothetical protein D9M70_527130 [compost metagenome]